MAVGTRKRMADWSQGPAIYHNHKNNHNMGRAMLSKRICSFWLAGRCNRNPCRFMHSKFPPSNTYQRNAEQSSHKEDKHVKQSSCEEDKHVKRSSYKAGKHIPSNTFHCIPKHSPCEADKLIPTQSFCMIDQCPNKSLMVHDTHQSSLVTTIQAVANSEVDERAPKTHDRVCQFWASGNCVKDECDFLHSWSRSHEITLLAKLREHRKEVSGIAFPEGSNKLFSGSKDGTVCVWDSHTGQCVQMYDLGGEVGTFICEVPWLFVGLMSSVKAWNIQSNMEYDLAGPAGLVHALAVANDRLFAGVQNGAILAWDVSSVANPFQLCASLKVHTEAVVSLTTGASRLYSGSLDQTIRVWDSTTLECLHTLNGHTDAVTSLLCWDQFLLSCSLDKTIKVWVATEGGNIEVTYTHYEDHGVLSLFGMHDGDVNPVLFCACNDKSVHLYNLPNFTERGRLFSEQEVRTIGLGPGGVFFSGDAAGTLAVWKWSAETDLKKVASMGSTLSSPDSCAPDSAGGERGRDPEMYSATLIEV